MKKFALPLCLLLLFPVQTFAQNSQDSVTRANDCDGLARACSGAARELKAARNLIAGYEAQITAADARIELAKKEIDSLRQLSMLEGARAMELEVVIAAEREAKASLIELKKAQEKRIASLKKQVSGWRKFALIAGTAAVVAILVGIRK